MLPKQLSRTVIYKSDWVNVYTDRVLLPSGKIIEKYHLLDYPKEAVVTLAVNNEGQICFIKALRYSTQSIEWELPAGGIDKGENPLEAASREFLEETGFVVEHLKLVQSYYPSNGMSNQIIHVVFAKAGIHKNQEFDTDEVEAVHWISKEKAKGMIRDGSIKDGLSLTGLLLYFMEENS